MRPIRMAAVLALALLLQSAITASALDHRYSGELTLKLDLANPGQRIFRIQERIPASAGVLTLNYPKWIPGEHSPSGPIGAVTGLIISTETGQRVDWRRDLDDMFVLHVRVPPRTTSLQLQFELLSPGLAGNFDQGVSVTDGIEDLEWNQVLFYPAGYAARDIPVHASVQLPAGWAYAIALTTVTARNNLIDFKAVSLEQLVDSPLITGLYFARIDLAPGARGSSLCRPGRRSR